MSPSGSGAVWLARCVRDAEVAGSNPAFPTRNRRPEAPLTRILEETLPLSQFLRGFEGLRSPSSEEELGHLDRVERGPLAEVVGHAEELEGLVVIRVLADAAHVTRVGPRRFQRCRVDVVPGVVSHGN